MEHAVPGSGRQEFVFVSHASPDKPNIKPIVDALRHAGLRVWLDNPAKAGYGRDEIASFERIRAGRGTWNLEIKRALRKAACVLVCWSKNAVTEKFLSGFERVVWLSEIAVADHDGTMVSCIIDNTDAVALPGAYPLTQCPRVGEDLPEPERLAAIAALIDDVKAKMEEVIRDESKLRERADYRPPPFDLVAPPDPVAGFVGRKDLLLRIDGILQSSRIAVIHGMGGMGKTSLAKEYIKEFCHRYDGIAWVSAETREGMMKGIAALGRAWDLKLKEDPEDDVIARETLRQIGEQPGVYLFVYDNIDLPRQIEELHHPPNTYRLITSRRSNWAGISRSIGIAELSIVDAAALLKYHADRDEKQSDAERLAETLGCLPLALVQAGAICRLQMYTFSEYMNRFDVLIDEEPYQSSEDDPPITVFKTFKLSLDALKAGKSGETPEVVAKRSASLESLIALLAYCSPERIPIDLITSADDTPECRRSLMLLAEASLVRYEAFPDESPGIVVHRLVQEVARQRADANGTARPAIRQLIDRLATQFPSEMRDDTWPTAVRLMPHLLSVLPRVREEEFRPGEERNLLDRLVSSVVFALQFATEDQCGQIAYRINPYHLARVLTRFYEVEPLYGALHVLFTYHRHEWPHLQAQLLTANNYVLRFAMATPLANACLANPPSMRVEDVAALVDPKRGLNAFELGGYALNLIYASNPQIIDRDRLASLAEHPCYPGRSILGDMMLNLVFQGFKPRDWLTSKRFWNPIWDHVAIDVHTIDAAEPFLSGRRLPADSTAGAREAYENLEEINRWRCALLETLAPEMEPVAGLLRGYFKLGVKTRAVWEARDEIAKLPDMREFMRLFFEHPVWSVAESAASVLANLIRRKKASISVVTDLFDTPIGRYGAMEASYQLRDFDNLKSFTDAIHRFYDDANCEVRGLCAENIIAEILNLGGDERDRRLREFEIEIRRWLKDDDCWVLEHVYRLFNTLHESAFEFGWLLSDGVSPLFHGKREWYALSREKFLGHIDEKKHELLNDEKGGSSR